MTLRRWEYSDILRISQLEKECFPKDPWSFQLLATTFQTPGFLGEVAEEGGEVVGYGSVVVGGDAADVQVLGVAEAYRRCGTATALLDAICAGAADAGADNVFLEVRVSNSAALMLYLGYGFTGLYARSRYYADGEDCLVMCKELRRASRS